jgi:hypothetical protein
VDFDIKRVRLLRIYLRAIEVLILAFFAIYVAFLAYFILYNTVGFDVRFAVSLWLIVAFEILRTNRDIFISPRIFSKISRWLFPPDKRHLRRPNETEKNIVESFFETRKLEKPVFFVEDNPNYYNAFVGHCHGTLVYVINERLFQSCSIREIWAILAHERGHVENGDVAGHNAALTDLKDWLFYLSLWFSALALLKIFLYFWFFPELLLYSLSTCILVSDGIIFFLVVLKGLCDKCLCCVMQILADNTGAQKLGSAIWMLECLQMVNLHSDFPDFPLREKALLWILSDETLKLKL